MPDQDFKDLVMKEKNVALHFFLPRQMYSPVYLSFFFFGNGRISSTSLFHHVS
jgi:hypothetical protein